MVSAMTDATRARDIDAALDTASRCRRDASIYRQMGFEVLAHWLIENAKARRNGQPSDEPR